MLSRTSAAFCLFVVGIAIIIPGRAQRNPSGNATLFEGARLIAGDGGAAIESAAFVVENGRFSSVGRKGQIQAPPNATRIDLTGKTVMPAMVDVHSHFGFLNQRDGSMSKANFNRQNLIEHLQRYAYHGFAGRSAWERTSASCLISCAKRSIRVRLCSVLLAADWHGRGLGRTIPRETTCLML